MTIPLICIALLGLLGFGLGFAVSMTRAKTKTVAGSSTAPDDVLYKMVRTHGNTMEYAPFLALLIYILSLTPYPAWTGWMMIIVTAARYLFVVGMLRSKTLAEPHPLRAIGALGTYIGGIALCVALLLQGF